jgi:hypothetical protein
MRRAVRRRRSSMVCASLRRMDPVMPTGAAPRRTDMAANARRVTRLTLVSRPPASPASHPDGSACRHETRRTGRPLRTRRTERSRVWAYAPDSSGGSRSPSSSHHRTPIRQTADRRPRSPATRGSSRRSSGCWPACSSGRGTHRGTHRKHPDTHAHPCLAGIGPRWPGRCRRPKTAHPKPRGTTNPATPPKQSISSQSGSDGGRLRTLRPLRRPTVSKFGGCRRGSRGCSAFGIAPGERCAPTA